MEEKKGVSQTLQQNRCVLLGVRFPFTYQQKSPRFFKGLKYRGGDRIRTGVQTYSPKAFYMLISLLLVGDTQEMNKPMYRLAGWS